MQKYKRFTPDNITELKGNEIFVFGSNLAGLHRGGAARAANLYFGAEWGVGVGLTGHCYAIPTMHGGVKDIKPYVDAFVKDAAKHTDKIFLVTKIACGIAGFKPNDIAPLFKECLAMENVYLPKEFVEVLDKNII